MQKNISQFAINVIMGIKFTTLFKLVMKNGTSIRPKYVIRLIFLIPNSLISQILFWGEKLKFGKSIKQTTIQKPPVFIVGHWRSGTTLLHQLISLDNQFTTPTLVQTIVPDHFLLSTKYYVPILKKILPAKRPMDEVRLEPDAPMEDEFGLIRMGCCSPFEKLLFPSTQRKFLSDIKEFVPEGKALIIWKKNFLTLLKKITFLKKKQIVIKNPFHTPRILMLSEMFPGARFIHIVRHPYKIIPSSVNMWQIVAQENALKDGWKKPTIDETAILLRDFWNSVKESQDKPGKNEFSFVRYEDIEINPVLELKRIYKELNLDFSTVFESRIIRFMEEKKNYKKNSFILSVEEKNNIYQRLSHYFDIYNYES